MKYVYPVYYRRSDRNEESTYFIVASSVAEAEDIAYDCIANNPCPSDGPDRPSSYGREIAQVWVRDSWAQPTECDHAGLIGTGSEILLAKALALYVKATNQLH